MPLSAGGSYLFEPLVLRAKLHALWTGIIFPRKELRAERILIEGDSATVIGWIQDNTQQLDAHPLLHNIWTT